MSRTDFLDTQVRFYDRRDVYFKSDQVQLESDRG